MTRIKICGITEIEHAIVATEAEADFIGLVFAPSRRQIAPAKAKIIISALRKQVANPPSIAGVFVNTPAEEINRIADFCGLDWVQLSGDEDWDLCRTINRPIIKAIHMSARMEKEINLNIQTGYDLFAKDTMIFLLDTQVKDSFGGTGMTFNWQLSNEVSKAFPVMIAGGLTPQNVESLIKEHRPWGVDVSTGVETEGEKDKTKIIQFINAVKSIDGSKNKC